MAIVFFEDGSNVDNLVPPTSKWVLSGDTGYLIEYLTNRLHFKNGSSAAYANAAQAIPVMPTVGDCEILCRVEIPVVTAEQYMELCLRCDGAWSTVVGNHTFPNNGYTLEIGLTSGQMTPGKITAGNWAAQGTPVAISIAAGDKWWFRFRVTGFGTMRYQARWWKDGLFEDSRTWLIDSTDTTPYQSGIAQIAFGGGNLALQNDQYITNLTVDDLFRVQLRRGTRR